MEAYVARPTLPILVVLRPSLPSTHETTLALTAAPVKATPHGAYLSPSRYSLVSFSVSACFCFPNHLDTIVCVTTKRLVSERWPEFVAPTPMMNCYRKSIFLSKLKSCSKNNTTAKSFLASLGYRCTWLATRPFSPPGRPSSVRPLAAVSCSSSSLSGVMYVPIARIA